MKKLSLLIAIILLITVIVGCQGKESKTDTPDISETTSDETGKPMEKGKLFEQPIKLSLTMVEHPTYPYNPESFLTKKLLEIYNVDLEVTPIQDGYYDKLNLDMASGQMTDLIWSTSYNDTVKMGSQGALVDYIEYLDKMPNFKKWSEEHKEHVIYCSSANGELFALPNLGYGDAGNRTFWMYRKDLFEKHNLSLPKTDDDLYLASKALKEIYPDSYPVVHRSFPNVFSRVGVQWNTGYPMYYNIGQKKWIYGPTEDNFKDMLMFYSKMYDEELIPPNTLTLDTKGMQDFISTNKSFITSEYVARIDYFNVPMRQENPEFSLQFMPPFKGGANGFAEHSIQDTFIFSGLSIYAQSKNKDACIKFTDTFFSEDGINLRTWGVEGESYEIKDGKKKYIGIEPGDGYFEVIIKYGFFQRGFYQIIDPYGMSCPYSEDSLYAMTEAPKYDHQLRAPFVPFTTEAEEQKSILEVNINTHMEENISMFIIGERPFSEWDAYKKELEALGVNDLVKIYNDSYNEFLEKTK